MLDSNIILAALVLTEEITILKSTGVLIIIAGVVSMAGCDEEHFRACSYNNGHLHIS